MYLQGISFKMTDINQLAPVNGFEHCSLRLEPTGTFPWMERFPPTEHNFHCVIRAIQARKLCSVSKNLAIYGSMLVDTSQQHLDHKCIRLVPITQISWSLDEIFKLYCINEFDQVVGNYQNLLIFLGELPELGIWKFHKYMRSLPNWNLPIMYK